MNDLQTEHALKNFNKKKHAHSQRAPEESRRFHTPLKQWSFINHCEEEFISLDGLIEESATPKRESEVNLLSKLNSSEKGGALYFVLYFFHNRQFSLGVANLNVL